MFKWQLASEGRKGSGSFLAMTHWCVWCHQSGEAAGACHPPQHSCPIPRAAGDAEVCRDRAAGTCALIWCRFILGRDPNERSGEVLAASHAGLLIVPLSRSCRIAPVQPRCRVCLGRVLFYLVRFLGALLPLRTSWPGPLCCHPSRTWSERISRRTGPLGAQLADSSELWWSCERLQPV